MPRCRCGKEIVHAKIIKEDGTTGSVPLDMSAPVYSVEFNIGVSAVAKRLDPKTHGVNHFKTCAHANDFNKNKPKPCTGESI